ncbi:MAG: single-stranded-DNA-specific exonuclease RecJ [Chloroflexi bacterium]|nr:single-stranded-DNA-specific exonuclease RecJ [Chloroflexota bacterium]
MARSDPLPPLTGETARYGWAVQEIAPREHLVGFAGLSPLLIQLLWNRGIRSADEIHAFLAGATAPVHSPWELHGITAAVDRIARARASRESVVVYGDYDVDGITSTVLLTECLRMLGVNARPFVPRRHVEGYGLNRDALSRLRQDGTSLVVAVDCGISGAAEVEAARQIGLEVIIADHHHVPDIIPDAVAVINPKQPSCRYPFKELCAVGLAYQLARALGERLAGDAAFAERWLDLVALGTVADVVPLVGENRTLVLRGLPRLNTSQRPGVRALALRAGIPPGEIDARAIAYALAPRLNATGRLADASVSVRLLLTGSEEEARSLAGELDALNRERQRLTDAALTQAREEILARGQLPKLLLVAGADYPSGVVGLVAARLVEEFWRPAVVLEVDSEVARGSARSIDGFHIAEALARCADLLARHGGHARAAGFTVPLERLDELRARLEAIANAEISDADLMPRLTIDAEIRLARYGAALGDLVRQLEPFGFGNPVPLFLSRRIRVLEARAVGQDEPAHLRLRLHDGTTTWDAIGFGMGAQCGEVGEHADIVYSVERTIWNGSPRLRLRLRDLRPSVT